MKTYIEIFFLPLLIVFIFSGCSTKIFSSYKVEEVFAEKQVLVYDKTISISDNNFVHFLQFSPTNKDELAVSLKKKVLRSLDETTTHFALIDLKSGKIKKDMELGQYTRLNGKKGGYTKDDFQYSDDGNKLYLSRYLLRTETDHKLEVSRGRYTTLDLVTESISAYHNYSCDELIPKEFKKTYDCSKYRFFNNMGYYTYKDELSGKLGEGIVIYDKDSFKAKKIITADNRLDTQFRVVVISEDEQYVLFEKIIRDSKEHSIDKKYVVYDLKNDKSIHSFDAPFTTHDRGEAFIDKDTLLFEYATDATNSKRNIGIVNLFTNEKKSFSCGKEMCPITQRIYNLNNRYLIWAWFSTIHIFDIKEMKIVQQFKAYDYAVSKDFKKVAFNTLDKIYIYNIMEE